MWRVHATRVCFQLLRALSEPHCSVGERKKKSLSTCRLQTVTCLAAPWGLFVFCGTIPPVPFVLLHNIDRYADNSARLRAIHKCYSGMGHATRCWPYSFIIGVLVAFHSYANFIRDPHVPLTPLCLALWILAIVFAGNPWFSGISLGPSSILFVYSVQRLLELGVCKYSTIFCVNRTAHALWKFTIRSSRIFHSFRTFTRYWGIGTSLTSAPGRKNTMDRKGISNDSAVGIIRDNYIMWLQVWPLMMVLNLVQVACAGIALMWWELKIMATRVCALLSP